MFWIKQLRFAKKVVALLIFFLSIFIFSDQLPHKHKVVIAGNHDLTFDKSMDDHLDRRHVNLKEVKAFLQDEGVTEVKDLLTNCIYLEDSMVNLYGINIYGSPW